MTAYKAKSVELHPDNNTDRDTSREMTQLNIAYNLLSDPQKRAKYDKTGEQTLGDVGMIPALPAGKSEQVAQVFVKGNDTVKVSFSPDGTVLFVDKNGAVKKAAFETVEDAAEHADMVISSLKSQGYKEPGDQDGQTFVKDDSTIKISFGPDGKSFIVDKDGVKKRVAFDDEEHAQEHAELVIAGLRSKGYKLLGEEEPAAPAAAAPKAKAAAPAGKTPNRAVRDAYKVYGKLGDAPVHTRIKSRAYLGGKDTKFKPNTKGNVAFNDDGSISITDPETGHTQRWPGE